MKTRLAIKIQGCDKCPVRFFCYTTSRCTPETTDRYEERILDLTCDVWGGAGPDCCIQPS